MRGPRAWRTAALLLGLVATWLPTTTATSTAAAAATSSSSLPPGFSELVVATGLRKPTAFDIAADGQVFVAEQRGVIKVFDNALDPTPSVLADLRTSVHHFWDRGLLGLEVDPAFPERPYVYILYDHDAPPGGQGPVWGQPGSDSDGCHPDIGRAIEDGCVASTRVSRLRVEGGVVASEKVLVGDVCTQSPAHTGGGLAFDDTTGTLYAAFGDGAWSFSGTDHGQHGVPPNPCGDPPGPAGQPTAPPTAEGGSLRSQDLRTPADPLGLSGTVIAIDPDTGVGAAGDPTEGAEPNLARIAAHGFRNPFRITTRPGTGEVWVGDVGFTEWEEIDRVLDPAGPAENFGWPCFEGPGRQPGFDALDLDICENLYAEQGTLTPSAFEYRHGERVAAGDSCGTGGSAITGLAFHPGGSYPSEYQGTLFFADAVRSCIWAVPPGPDGLPDPSARSAFRTGIGGVVDLRAGPGGDLYYLTLSDGSLRRIRHDDGNVAPTAVIDAEPAGGAAPLTVTLDGGRSNDADGDALDFGWDLDDDGVFDDATSVAAEVILEQPGNHTARLRVTDGRGASGTDERIITVSGAPTASIAEPSASTTWATGEEVRFAGSGTDELDGPLAPSQLTWSLFVHHCHDDADCHAHHVTDLVGVSEGSIRAPPHEWPARLELRLTATNSRGVTDVGRVVLEPRTAQLTVQSDPSGLSVRVGGTVAATPLTRTVIVGSPTTVSAASPQTADGRVHDLEGWSDGGPATHSVSLDADTTLTAGYRARNRPPVADAGPDSAVRSRAAITLDGTRSSDPDGDPLTYEWRQVGAPPAVLRDERLASARVDGMRGPAFLVFELVVTDPDGLTATDQVRVTVRSK